MKVTKTFKYKLKLTKPQSKRIDSWIGTCRFIYNLALELRKYAYTSFGKSIHKFELMRQVTELRQYYPWIKDVPADSLQLVIEKLHHSYERFFSGAGFPKWAKKDKFKSIKFKGVKQQTSGFFIPKLGDVKVFKDRMPNGPLKTATIRKENNEYFLTVVFETESCNIYPTDKNQVVGLDMGLTYLLTDSEGRTVKNPRQTQKYEKRLRLEQRSLTRKKKGSKRRDKQKLKLAKLYKKIHNTRKDFLDKLSKDIVQHNHIIICEDLKVSNMVKVSTLSKHISDASWSSFFYMLNYKAVFYEKLFVQVDPKYTSQTCSCCGCIAKENRQSQSKFECITCGHQQNADHNAALNIKSQGMALIRQRETIVCA